MNKRKNTEGQSNKSFLGLIVSLTFFIVMASSCTAVKPYQKVNLNDPDMQLSAHKSERFETNYQVYREGANGGKSGGGCGCN
ncbi:MAG: hypothetical protein ACJA1A_003949 [Saprospiraceae bacterium]|jgi:hypothetical protein